MMNIREYFENLYNTAANENEFNEIMEIENKIYEMNDENFETWAQVNNVDLSARNESMNELIVTLWTWDMCGE